MVANEYWIEEKASLLFMILRAKNKTNAIMIKIELMVIKFYAIISCIFLIILFKVKDELLC